MRSTLSLGSSTILVMLIAAPAIFAGPATAPTTHANSTVIVDAVSFCGNKAHGQRIVFLCDATGSMMSKFDLCRVELRRSIEGLNESQSFNVVFFQENAKPAVFTEVRRATIENKKIAFDYIDNYAARGPTDPLPAVDAAIAMNPDLLYFLVDPSNFPDKPAVLERFSEKNPARKNPIRVHTIAFIDKDPEDEKFLKNLATETGGQTRYVSEEDLAAQPESPAVPK